MRGKLTTDDWNSDLIDIAGEYQSQTTKSPLIFVLHALQGALSVCFYYTDQYWFMTMKRMCEKRYFGQTLTKYKMKIFLVSGLPPFQHRLVQTEN